MKQILLSILAILSYTLASAQQADVKPLSHEALLADYDYFFAQLESVHPDPYTDLGGETAFHQRVDALRQQLLQMPDLTPEEMQRQVMRLIAPLRDGHTYMGWTQAPNNEPDRWLPISLFQINDGIIIDGIIPEYKSLLGARLMAVEGVSIDELVERTGEIVMSENYTGTVRKTIQFLTNNNSASMLGLRFADDQAKLQLRLANDEDTLVTMPLYDQAYFDQHHDYARVAKDTRLPKRNMQYEVVDGTMVFRLSMVESRDNLAFEKEHGMDYEQELRLAWTSFYDEPCPTDPDSALALIPVITQEFGAMLQQMRDQQLQTLIVDLRNNGGGWTPILYATLYQLYGDAYLQKNMDITYASKISPLFLEKNGLTLEQLNADGSSYKMGDFRYSTDGQGCAEVNDSIRPHIIGGLMCADRTAIDSLQGKAIYTPARVYVLTNAGTFSAAFHFTFMLWKMGATIVGIPSGQAPNTFMEVTQFYLPNCGMQCSVSNSLQQFLPADHPSAKTLWPQIMPSYEDYRQHGFSHDTDLEMILR